jgi:5-methylcytosine-specific restriction protein A
MLAYLLTWNPAKWPWENLRECIALIQSQGYYDDWWGCGSTRRIQPGDRVFLMKLGREPRGIVASGRATSGVYQREHWGEVERVKGKRLFCVNVRFDALLDPEHAIFPRARLKAGLFAKMHWEPQGSGISIPEDVAATLEEEWVEFTNQSGSGVGEVFLGVK